MGTTMMTTLAYMLACYWILCLVKVAVMVARHWRDLAASMAFWNRKRARGRFDDRTVTLCAVAALFALAPVFQAASTAIRFGVLSKVRHRSYRNTGKGVRTTGDGSEI